MSASILIMKMPLNYQNIRTYLTCFLHIQQEIINVMRDRMPCTPDSSPGVCLLPCLNRICLRGGGGANVIHCSPAFICFLHPRVAVRKIGCTGTFRIQSKH